MCSRTSITGSTRAKHHPPDGSAPQGPLRRVGVRSIRQDRRARRRRGRVADRAQAARRRRAHRHAALRRHALGRVRGARRLAGRADVLGDGVGARARRQAPAQRGSGLLPGVQPLLRPPVSLRPAEPGLLRQPRALHVPVARRAGDLQGAGLHPRRHSLQRLANRAGAGLPEYLRMGATAARQRQHLFDSQPRVPGRARIGRAVHHRARAGALQPRRVRAFRRAESDQGGALSQHVAEHGQPHLRARDPDRRVRLRARRRARVAQPRPARHPERHRRRRVEPLDRSVHPRALRRAPHGRQGEVQGGAAKGSGPAGAAPTCRSSAWSGA